MSALFFRFTFFIASPHVDKTTCIQYNAAQVPCLSKREQIRVDFLASSAAKMGSCLADEGFGRGKEIAPAESHNGEIFTLLMQLGHALKGGFLCQIL